MYGDLSHNGFVIDWHNCDSTSTGKVQDLSREGCLQLCLNFCGEGSVQARDRRFDFGPQCAFLLVAPEESGCVTRSSQQQHSYLTVSFSSQFLRRELNENEENLHAQVLSFLGVEDSRCCSTECLPLSEDHRCLVASLLRPGCEQRSCRLRSRGLVLQLMADFFYDACCDSDAPCDRQRCMARERVQGVVAILQRNLADPPSLEAIGREVGCSPYHLSRIFSKETGMTIPRYLQAMRVRRAAELLRGGRCNVTEAALAVGYSSLSHFSQVFCRIMGCCPLEYSTRPAGWDKGLHSRKAFGLLSITEVRGLHQ